MLGQQVIVENVGGAGGMVGSARVAKAPPDGYQFVLGSRADAINQTLYKKPLYNLRDRPGAGRADRRPADVLVARKDLPVNTLPEFIAHAKTEPGHDAVRLGRRRLDRPSSTAPLLNAAIGVNITHVPYRGGGPAMQDLIGGRIDYFCTLTGTGGAADRGRHGQGDRRADARARADAAERPERVRAGLQGFRGLDLVRLLRAEGHARRRSSSGCTTPPSTAMDTPSVQEQLLASGAIVVAARAPLDRIPAEVHVEARSRRTARRSRPPASRWNSGTLEPPSRSFRDGPKGRARNPDKQALPPQLDFGFARFRERPE